MELENKNNNILDDLDLRNRNWDKLDGVPEKVDLLIESKANKVEVDASLELKANKQQEAWITPTLLNGATGTVQYMIDNFGFVHFRGRLLTIASGATAFNLPIGYRLTLSALFPVVGNIAGSFAVLSIGDGYQLNPVTNLSGAFYVDLSGISFKAER